MLQKLNNHLTEVTENIAIVDKILSPHFYQGDFRCSIEHQIVHFEYKHGLNIEKSKEQAKLLLKALHVSFFSIKGGYGGRNLLLKVEPDEETTELYLDFSIDSDDNLLTQYLCEQLLLLFKKLSVKSK